MKSSTVSSIFNSIVAPLVGAWIEIFVLINLLCHYPVAPLVGAWIEIRKELYKMTKDASLLL